MRNIYPNIFKFNKKNLLRAQKLLKKNNVIGVPTETVYGLAGNAYSEKSIKKIYKLKRRPKKNPLIVHYYDLKILKRDAIIDKNFEKLYKKFSPGPLTYILKKKSSSKLCNLTSSNLKSVAVRFPKNKIIRSILRNISFPLAIPSANISESISPVRAKDIIDDFGKKINFIFDGGFSKIGLESTVINLIGKIQILRPGFISPNEIGKVLKRKIIISKNFKKIRSPGLLKRHYSPGIPMKLNCKKNEYKAAFIVFGKKYKNKNNLFNLSPKGNLKEAAKNLYKIFRAIKKLKYKKINVVKIPNKGIGVAINDRLKKASR